MPQTHFLPMIRMARCFQAFESFSARHVRTLGLTVPQFDIIATLGKAFADVNPDELQQAQTQLARLGNIFRLTTEI